MPINFQQTEYFSALELFAKQVVEGFITGLHKSPFHGFSVEFAEHRLYNTGESTRHLDWKLLARTDKLFIKRYEEETNLRCTIVVDTSSSMLFPMEKENNKLNFSIHAAAALIYLFRKQRDAFGISLFDEHLNFHSEVKSSVTHQKYLFSELEKQLEQKQLNKSTQLSAVINEVAERTHKRSLVILFSDMFQDVKKEEELFSALQHLKHKKHEVLLFHVTSKKEELDFEFENRPISFIDMESGKEVKTFPNDVKKAYLDNLSTQTNELKLRCGQYGIDFIEADINEGFNNVLFEYLVKRKKMI